MRWRKNGVEGYHIFGTNGFKIWEVFQLVRLEKYGKWKPGYIFFVKNTSDVMDILGNIDRDFSGNRECNINTIDSE